PDNSAEPIHQNYQHKTDSSTDRHNRNLAPSSTWTLIGPSETFWKLEDNAAQPPAPWQTNVYAIAVAPSDHNILYACPEDGAIFKSIDKGLNWSCVTLNYTISTCTAIAVDPTNPNIVYAGASNMWFQSNDGGNTWTITLMTWGNVNSIIIKPSNPNTIFVATEYGLFRKSPAGSSINQNTAFNLNALTTTSSTWNRNNTGASCTATAGTNQYYHVFPFTVSTSGSYTFAMCTPGSDWDAFASIYKNGFNGLNPCGVPANHLYSDDDANSGGNCNNDPLITLTLNTGTTYYFVSSSWFNNITGAFQWTFTGPAGAMLTTSVESWIQVPTVNTQCPDISYKTDNENILFCLKQVAGVTEFWRSMDGGTTFTQSMSGWSTGITADGLGRMTVSTIDPNRIYVVILSSAPITKPFIQRSTDAGLTWITTCTGESSGLTGTSNLPLGMSNGQGFYDLDIMGNPNNANDVIVATTTAYKSTDGGFTFNRIGGYGGSFNIHPDIQEMTATGTDTWIATDGGISYSTDFFTSTSNYSCRMKGIFSSDMWGFAQGWNENIIGGGRYHNGNTVMNENFAAGEAIRLGGGEAASGYYMIGRPRYIAFSDITPVITPTVKNGPSSTFSFTKSPNEDGYGSDWSDIEFLPYCYNHIYVGKDSVLYKSTDGGLSWAVVHDFGLERIKRYVISRSNPDVIYLSTYQSSGSIYRFRKSIDAGASWTTLTLPSGANAYRMTFAISALDENIIWMTSPSNTSGNRVFKSVTGGSTWINLTTNTINGQSYKTIVHQYGTDGGVYLTGDNGKVFYRNNTMADWSIFNTGLPVVSNNKHVKPFYRDGKLRSAGDHGVWQVDFYEDAPPVAQPTVDKLTTSCFRDTFYFEDYSAFKQSGGTWLWSFPGATYVSSTSARNPKVLYSAVGTYDFALTVTNAMGSSSKMISQKIMITANQCQPDTIPGKLLTLIAPGDYAQQSKAINISTNNITLSCWIKPNGIQVPFAGILFSANGGATGMNFRSSNQIGYHWADGSDSYNWAGGPTIPADEWSHLALVVTGSTATVYLNGVAYIRTAAHNAVTFDKVFQFGIDRSNTARNFKGKLDEICFYNRALTQNEIRELMNLTRNNPNAGSLPPVDPSLIAYYQYNEGAGIPAYDKVGTNHAYLTGGAIKTDLSSSPVGGGVFQRIAVTNSGVKDFNTPGVELTFPPAGTYPNGDLVVSRINVPSDPLPTANVLPNAPVSYYVIRNYGTNATFSSLTGMKLKNVQGTAAPFTLVPSTLQLFKRPSNADGMTWGMSIDNADVVTDNNSVGTVEFTTGLNVTSFSQFSIGLIPDCTTLFCWNGSASTAWENPSNWGCAGIPHSNSTVIINSGLTNYPVVSLSTQIKYLLLQKGAGVDVVNGVMFRVIGQ
ncbi:MAG: LamG-like jellyroll fold domain-containing protein, partial [Saprospiraceae bacterium]